MTRTDVSAVQGAELDLVLERIVAIAPEQIWACWTQPELLTRWFTPDPWQTIQCEIDLRPGGVFSTRMRGPDGQEFSNTGCILEVVPNRRLIWTGALAPGFRPLSAAQQAPHPFLMTVVISLEALGHGTRYTARALHADFAGRDQHEAMGFITGWSKALDQLVEVVQGRRA